MGDFNIFTTDGDAFGELLKAKFDIPLELQEFCTNANRNRQYDQIAFRIQEDRLGTTGKANVFNFFDYVYRLEDENIYVDFMGEKYRKKASGKLRTKKERSTYYKTYWRTHQMSDHLPLWVELNIDYSKQYLERKKQGEIKPIADPK